MSVLRILLYLAILISAVVFFALYHRWFSWYLLVLIVLLIPFDLLLSLLGMFNRRITLHAPKIVLQGTEATLRVKTHSTTIFPAGLIKVKIHERGEEKPASHRISFSSSTDSQFEKSINTEHSGFVTFSYERFWVNSLLGLFALPQKAKGRSQARKHNNKVGVLILPAAKKPPRVPVLPKVSALRPSRCGIFSEDHDLRSFRSGDPLKSVHWKLSAKHDSLIVREPLLPEFPNCLISVAPWSNKEERDLILGRLHWVCEYLLMSELGEEYHLYAKLGQEGAVAAIAEMSEVMDYLRHILGDSTVAPNFTERPPHFTWVYRVDGAGADE